MDLTRIAPYNGFAEPPSWLRDEPMSPREKLQTLMDHFQVKKYDLDRISGARLGHTSSFFRKRKDGQWVNSKIDHDYVKPIAKHYGIPLAWFYDGADTQIPTAGDGSDSDSASSSESYASAPLIPIEYEVPSSISSPRVLGTVAEVPPPGVSSGYARVVDDLYNTIVKRGDFLLVMRVLTPRHGALHLVRQPNGTLDVVKMERRAGRFFPIALSEEYSVPEIAIGERGAAELVGLVGRLRWRTPLGMWIVLEDTENGILADSALMAR